MKMICAENQLIMNIFQATATCITKGEKDEKEGSREKPKKNEEVAKKKTPTDKEIKVINRLMFTSHRGV